MIFLDLDLGSHRHQEVEASEYKRRMKRQRRQLDSTTISETTEDGQGKGYD